MTDSSYDSPYRSGRHVPLNGANGALTSVATASESRADINAPYSDDRPSSSVRDLSNTHGGARAGAASPLASPGGNRPYSPGLRSMVARQNSSDGFETASPTGEIPMQSFRDGLPPPPPVSHSWNRIDRWAEEHYPELW